MTKMIEISDRLAAEIERKRQTHGFPTFDVTVEAMIAFGLDATDGDELALEAETLQALVDEAEASGPAQPWNAADEFAEIRAGYVADKTP